MSYIQVDARGCGAGKTRNTIVPRIKNNMRMGIRTLLVVPSKTLQGEYKSMFNHSDITIINADGGRILDQYQTCDSDIICMTHQGFLQTPTGCLNKENTDLIIDEAFDPYSIETFSTVDSAGRSWVDFSQVFDWAQTVPGEKPKSNPQPYFELCVVGSTPPDIIDAGKWRKIANPNYRIFATWETGNNLINNTVETATLALQLDECVLDNWSSVWIAAAVFDKTMMGSWMRGNCIPYDIAHEFVPHKVPVDWHMPTEEFVWSKGCRDANPEIEGVFRDYCNQHRVGRLIYNKNNDSDTHFLFSDKLTHNAHGINAYKDRLDYAFMSAIQPTAQYRNFLAQTAGLTGKDLAFAFSGYTAYQLIMRTALRDPNNTQRVNIFALDTDMILSVMDLYDPKSYETYPNIPVEDKRKANKSRPLTNAQKQKQYRERKRANKTTP